MDDRRRLREITPGKRGWRFVGSYRGRTLRANVPYLVVTSAGVTTRHYTEAGARKRVRILATSGVEASALAFEEQRWLRVTTAAVTRR